MLKFSRKWKYNHLSSVDREDNEELLPQIETTDNTSTSPTDSLNRFAIAGGATIFLVSFTIGLLLGSYFPARLDSICTRHVTKYSLVTEDVDIKYDIVQFNGSFMHEDIYRQDASPEVDAAWEALGVYYRPVLIPEALSRKSGLTKDHVQVNPKYGGGYPAYVEGFHQLHCLNLLRKSLYYNYEYYSSRKEIEFSDSVPFVRLHVSHCLDFLRQRLMCDIDIGTFGSVWVNQTHPRPWVDFNTKHVCRNFDDVRAWAEKHQIPDNTPEDYIEVPEGGVEILELAP